MPIWETRDSWLQSGTLKVPSVFLGSLEKRRTSSLYVATIAWTDEPEWHVCGRQNKPLKMDSEVSRTQSCTDSGLEGLAAEIRM